MGIDDICDNEASNDSNELESQAGPIRVAALLEGIMFPIASPYIIPSIYRSFRNAVDEKPLREDLKRDISAVAGLTIGSIIVGIEIIKYKEMYCAFGFTVFCSPIITNAIDYLYEISKQTVVKATNSISGYRKTL